MSKELNTKPIPSNCKVEAVRLVAQCKHTTGRRLCKNVLKFLALLFVCCLGFILNELRYRDRLDGVHFYVYDTEQKLDNYYRILEKQFFDQTKDSPELSEAREFMTMVRMGGQPLVEVGPFSFFLIEDGDRCLFSLREIQTSMPLIEFENRQRQPKRLQLSSSIEKGWGLPRFTSSLRYSEEGIYEKGGFFVSGQDGVPVRAYFDTQGTGVFDIMQMHVKENGEQITYYLSGLIWEREDEQFLDNQGMGIWQLFSPEPENE